MMKFSLSKRWLMAATALTFAIGCQCQSGNNPAPKKDPGCQQDQGCQPKPTQAPCNSGSCSSLKKEEKPATIEAQAEVRHEAVAPVVEKTVAPPAVESTVRATLSTPESKPEAKAEVKVEVSESKAEAKSEAIVAPPAQLQAASEKASSSVSVEQ